MVETKITREQFKKFVEKQNDCQEELLQAYAKVFVPLLKKWDGKVYNQRFLNAVEQEIKKQGYGNNGEIRVKEVYRRCNNVTIYLTQIPLIYNTCIFVAVNLVTRYTDGNNRISEADTLSNEQTKAWLQGAFKSIQQGNDVVKNWDKYMGIANRLQEAVKAYNALPGCFTTHVERWQFDI